ncbi:MBL fold metallo-hydrolase [Yoonia maritima]|uniref:MBL fold metallo-hydrolase n=1 Tax=Yoonia maritima TaxID=1435347 RepID=UPI000D0EF98C|nr:MBL fold metallo-hydrolase [Yoonia maritima]
MEHIAHHKVEGVDVFCLTDGGLEFPPKIFPGVEEQRRETLLKDAGLTGVQTVFNCYVLRFSDGRIAMVDTGCGAEFGEKGGRMRRLLSWLGILPEYVSRIIFTHLHSDHCGGAVTGDELTFPNAEITLHVREALHWSGKASVAGRLLDRVSSVRTVRGGDDLGDGITVWSLPGHTPGHIGLRLGDLALVGDVVHSEALQLPDPATRPIYDEDPDLAIQSCNLALNAIVDDGLVWSGCHMLGPEKFARLERQGRGFTRMSL